MPDFEELWKELVAWERELVSYENYLKGTAFETQTLGSEPAMYISYN